MIKISFFIYLFFGIISNFIGPLGKHLSIEDKHSLEVNKYKNCFYKYSFILAIRSLFTVIYPLFYFSYYILKRKPQKPISFDAELNANLVKRLRKIGEYNNTAPTEKTSDEKIIEIYTLICTSFKNASINNHEHINANNLNTIAIKFIQVYEDFGENFMNNHLNHELKKYAIDGLRNEYKKEITLF